MTQYPTLVNCMGYSRGLGLNLTADIISKTEPTMLIQIQSRYSKKNYQHLLTPNFAQKNGLSLFWREKKKLSYDFVTVESMSDDRRGWQFQPRQTRELRVLAYLSQALSKDVVTITSPEVPVYRYVFKKMVI